MIIVDLYTGKYNKVEIRCPIHGIFFQQARCHSFGQGCAKCAHDKHKITKRLTQEQFLQKAKNKHGDLYNYKDTIYGKSGEKVKIYCKYHGLFEQSPHDHIAGAGCPTCANYSNYLRINYKDKDQTFLNELKGYLYVVHLFSDDEEFYKVGITKNPKNRFKELRKHYKLEQLYLEEDYLFHILTTENIFLKDFKVYKYIPKHIQCGKTECFSRNPLEYYYNSLIKPTYEDFKAI